MPNAGAIWFLRPTRPRTVSDLVADLSDKIRRLDTLRCDDGGGTRAPSVAAAFDLSYRQLDTATARVFRLLPINPGPDLSATTVEALAYLSTADARTALSRLARPHLVEAAAGGAGRWRMHDLVRLSASQLSGTYADADGREQARDPAAGLLPSYCKRGNWSSVGVAGQACPGDLP